MDWSHDSGAARRTPFRLLAAVCLALGALLPFPAPARAQAPRSITLQSPAAGATIASPVEVRGRVTVAPFENNLVGTVYDAAGRALGQGPVTVTPDVPGSLGGPGSFSARLSFDAAAGGSGRVEVADVSQADGSILASATADVILPGETPSTPGTGTTSWLDQPFAGTGWNAPGGALPAASATPGPPDPLCVATARPAETPEDEQVTGAGWRLFDAYQAGWDTRIVFGLTGYDGMCRPLGFQGFVFSGGAFAGTLSPQPMDARADGAYSSLLWVSPPPPGAISSFQASYSRYLGPQDALCCPAATSTVTFEVRIAGIVPGGRVLVPLQVQTFPNQSG
jgi:hypothetical protein